MDTMAKSAIATVVGPKIARHVRFSWLIYGAVAYFGLRYLNKKGVFSRQTGMALNLMDRGIDTAKEHMGLKTERSEKHDPKTTNMVH